MCLLSINLRRTMRCKLDMWVFWDVNWTALPPQFAQRNIARRHKHLRTHSVPLFAPNSFYEITNGTSSYNSMQLTYQHQTSFGLNMLANYTYEQVHDGPGVLRFRCAKLPC